MLEIERRRVQLGFSFIDVDNLAGLNDGYLAKMMWPDTPSGRNAGGETVQLVIDALFPKGFEVIIRQKEGAVLDEPSIRRMTYLARVPFDRKSQRDLMSKYGKRGRAVQLETQTPEQRQEIARRAALKRWSAKEARQ
jgi:hypothetical protein